MSAIGIARPGTPFPHATLHHSYTQHTRSASSSASSSSSSRALHFRIPELPSPTPPSLLKRASSSGSSSSSALSASYFAPRAHAAAPAPALLAVPRTPELVAPAPRRPSASSLHSMSSLSSAPSPTLPATPRATPAEPLDLPSPLIADADVPVHEYAAPGRPPFHRRDTPRPHTLAGLGLVLSDNGMRPKTLHSVIDGGAWVVVGV